MTITPSTSAMTTTAQIRVETAGDPGSGARTTPRAAVSAPATSCQDDQAPKFVLPRPLTFIGRRKRGRDAGVQNRALHMQCRRVTRGRRASRGHRRRARIWAIAQVRWPRRRAASSCCFRRWCLQANGSQLAILSALLPAPSRALLAPAEMLVTKRKRGFRCAAGSGGMQQPDRPSAGGVRVPRFRDCGSVLRAGGGAGSPQSRQRRRECPYALDAEVCEVADRSAAVPPHGELGCTAT